VMNAGGCKSHETGGGLSMCSLERHGGIH
jgi:hypothetical protein